MWRVKDIIVVFNCRSHGNVCGVLSAHMGNCAANQLWCLRPRCLWLFLLPVLPTNAICNCGELMWRLRCVGACVCMCAYVCWYLYLKCNASNGYMLLIPLDWNVLTSTIYLNYSKWKCAINCNCKYFINGHKCI